MQGLGSGAINGLIGGVTGVAGGTATGMLMTGDWNQAMEMGLNGAFTVVLLVLR